MSLASVAFKRHADTTLGPLGIQLRLLVYRTVFQYLAWLLSVWKNMRFCAHLPKDKELPHAPNNTNEETDTDDIV